MRGLRTQESEKFNKFFQIIQDKAAESDSIFFADCGEGNDIVTDDLEGEDMRGWLIPASQADGFEPAFLKDEVGDEWLDNMCWALWKLENNKVTIGFNWY